MNGSLICILIAGNQPMPLSPRQKVCSRKNGLKEKRKIRKKDKKRQECMDDRSLKKKKKFKQENDHESMRNYLGILDEASQGTLSGVAPLSTRNAGVLYPGNGAGWLSSHATGGRNDG
jgi:hypothetical protein